MNESVYLIVPELPQSLNDSIPRTPKVIQIEEAQPIQEESKIPVLVEEAKIQNLEQTIQQEEEKASEPEIKQIIEGNIPLKPTINLNNVTKNQN